MIPFTQILDLWIQDGGSGWSDEQIDAMRDLRILSFSYVPSLQHLGDADKPHLLVRGAGNDGSNYSWFLSPEYEDTADVFTRAIAANWFAFPEYWGTSISTPNVAASLASILSIFPDTSHQDLAKLARACAKKAGEGIDGPNGLLATSGGFGVADFSCMDEIVAAAADLSEDETATLTIDGREVTVRPRSITVTEPESR